MNKNKFSRYCTISLMVIIVKYLFLKKNNYYIRYGDNKSICINILNGFKDIKKSYEINVIDLTDNYYNIDKSNITKYCTILLINDINTSKIFISEKICTILDMMMMMMMMIVMNQCIIRF